MLLIITACSNKEVIKHNYIYKGENELWTAEYKMNGTGTFTEKSDKTAYESESNTTFTITYKNNISELSSVKHLEISYESTAGGGNLTSNFDNNNPLNQKTYILKGGGRGTSIERKDETIKVNITLDGKIQTIELKNIQ